MLRFLGLLLLATVAAANENAVCYGPDGAQAPGYYPCDPNAFVTMCCQQGYACYSNNLCVVVEKSESWPNLTVGDVKRSACTNPQWNNDFCGDFCLNKPNIGGEMGWCNKTNFCCQGDLDAGDCSCESGRGVHSVGDGKANTVIQVPNMRAPATPSYLSATTNTAEPSSASKSTPSRTSSSSTRSGSPTVTGDDPEDGEDSGGPSKSVKVGVGVGVSLGVLVLLGLVAGFIWRRKRAQRYASRTSSPEIVEPIHRGAMNTNV